MSQNSNKSGGSSFIMVAIFVLLLLFLLGQCSSSKVDGSFLNRDPRGWTTEEKRQYNNWQTWENKQK